MALEGHPYYQINSLKSGLVDNEALSPSSRGRGHTVAGGGGETAFSVKGEEPTSSAEINPSGSEACKSSASEGFSLIPYSLPISLLFNYQYSPRLELEVSLSNSPNFIRGVLFDFLQLELYSCWRENSLPGHTWKSH